MSEPGRWFGSSRKTSYQWQGGASGERTSRMSELLSFTKETDGVDQHRLGSALSTRHEPQHRELLIRILAGKI